MMDMIERRMSIMRESEEDKEMTWETLIDYTFNEELGITDFEVRFKGSYTWESPRERELVFSFLCIRYNRIHIDNDEVETGRFWNPQEIEEGISQNLFTPNLIYEYQTFFSSPFSKK